MQDGHTWGGTFQTPLWHNGLLAVWTSYLLNNRDPADPIASPDAAIETKALPGSISQRKPTPLPLPIRAHRHPHFRNPKNVCKQTSGRGSTSVLGLDQVLGRFRSVAQHPITLVLREGLPLPTPRLNPRGGHSRFQVRSLKRAPTASTGSF